MITLRTFIVAFVAVFVAGVVAGQWNPYADIIFTNGQIVSVDKSFTIHEGIAIKDGRIIAIGSSQSVMSHRGDSTQVKDLSGRALIPGIQDSHIHFLGLGHDVSYGIELSFVKNAKEIVDQVRVVKDRVGYESGEWLTGRRWDQYKYSEMVTRWDLDKVAPDNPIALYRVYRGIAVNTAVFRLMGIEEENPDTWPEWWLEDPKSFTFEDEIYRIARTVRINGEEKTLEVPTGVFLGSNGSALVTARPPDRSIEQDIESVRLGVKEMLRLGVTSIIDPSSRMGHNMRVYQAAYNRGYLDLRIAAVYEGTFNRHEPAQIDQYLDHLKINNLGNNFLRWRGVKVYADGGVGTRSAWVSEPFAMWEELEGTKNFGYPVVSDNQLREMQFRAALKHGWDLHTHNTGDQAMRQTVDLYMKLLNELRESQKGFDPRWSIIHAYFPIEPKTRVLEDMANYGIVAATNPVFNWQQGYSFATNSGRARMARLQPFRSYTEGGVVMASGSDYGVTTHNPWMGFYALLTRKDQKTGQVFGPTETIGIEDALRSYTWNGAYLTHEEDSKGSLEVGKLADLVVLDVKDIYSLERDPELCFEMDDKVLLTMVEGRIVFQKKEAFPSLQ